MGGKLDVAVPNPPYVDRLRSKRIGELLLEYRAILAELRRRGVVRTNNAPTGDYAEFLVAAHLGGELATNSKKSWDVQLSDQTRIQVKGRVLGGASRRGDRQLSTIRSWDFDVLAVVLFNDDYSVFQAALVPASIARNLARHISHVNGDRVYATDDLMLAAGATDISEELRVTVSQL